METLKNYLSQWSTWRGLLLVGSALAGVSPVAVEAIARVGDAVVTGQGAAAAAVAVVGAVEVIKNERKRRPQGK